VSVFESDSNATFEIETILRLSVLSRALAGSTQPVSSNIVRLNDVVLPKVRDACAGAFHLITTTT